MVLVILAFAVILLIKTVVRTDWAGIGETAAGKLAEETSGLAVKIWRHSYPAVYSHGQAEDGGEQKEDSTPWFLEWIMEWNPRYRYQKSLAKSASAYEEQDPSYHKYIENRDFYAEHEYLFQYGAEDTNQQTALTEPEPVPEEMPAGITGNMIPAYTVSNSHPVVGTKYMKAQLEDYDFLMKHLYSVHPTTTATREQMNINTLLSKDLKLDTSQEGPQILIYHTHSQETFADYSADHPERTVVGMGNYLTDLLTAKGYSVIHDTSVYDLKNGKLDRNKAYTYSLEGITSILQKNPSIQVMLDLHRDGVNESLHMVNEVNGKPTAPIMFFNGMSQTPDGPIEYLQNPYREDNLAFSLQMQLDAAAYYPGLTRKIYLKGLRYNLHLRPKSALIEVGAQTNTYEEARNAMEPLAELLDMVLQGK